MRYLYKHTKHTYECLYMLLLLHVAFYTPKRFVLYISLKIFRLCQLFANTRLLFIIVVAAVRECMFLFCYCSQVLLQLWLWRHLVVVAVTDDITLLHNNNNDNDLHSAESGGPQELVNKEKKHVCICVCLSASNPILDIIHTCMQMSVANAPGK